MASNIYAKLKEQPIMLTDSQINDLDEFLKYNYKSHISSKDISDKLDIKYEDAKMVNRVLLSEDIVEMNFKIYCKNEIDVDHKTIYENIDDIPDEPCDGCEKSCYILRNVIIVYKVVSEGLYDNE